MICPKCGGEYQKWATECSDCHVPLVSREDISPEDGERIVAMRPVKLVSASDGIQADLIAGMLKEQGIPVMRKKLGSGGYMQVYMGFSVYGEEIYVDEADYEQAAEVLGVLREVDPAGIEENTEEDGAGRWFRPGYGTRIVILTVIGILFLWMVATFLVSVAELVNVF